MSRSSIGAIAPARARSAGPWAGFALTAALLMSIDGTARAGEPECAGWLAGSLDNGTAPNGSDGDVLAMLEWDPDGAGPENPRLVIGGGFTSIEGVAASNIAMRDPVTGKWQPIGTGIGRPVYALTVFDGELVAGGFGDNNDDGNNENNILRWTGSTWETFWGGTTRGSVYALRVYNGVLYAGGGFLINPDAATNIARWNPGSGLWEGVAGGTNGPVRSLAEYNGLLIAGGDFTHAEVGVNRIARFDGASWSGLSTGMAEGSVTSLAVYLGKLYAGGTFSTAGGVSTGGFASWNGAWSAVGGVFNGAVYSMGVHNTQLVLGGLFPGIGSPNIALYNGTSYSALGSGGMDGPVRGVTTSGGLLFVGGSFAWAGGTVAHDLAQWDGTFWTSLGGGTAAQVRAMTTFFGRLVVAGDFHQSAEPVTPIHNIARWDGVELRPYGTGTNGLVLALESFKYPGAFGKHELIAGGQFTRAGGVTVSNIARWVEDAFSPLPPAAWQPMGTAFNGPVYAIERHAGVTYAGGTFTGSGLSRIARWNETTDVWEAMGTGMNGTVYALKSFNNELYAGGSFTTAGGIGTGGLARWNGTGWSAVGGFFNGFVYALEVHDGRLVMAGNFAGFGGSPNISSWSGTSYANLGTGGTNAEVYALSSNGARLYVGGDFTLCGNVPVTRAAYWDGEWHDVAGGADDSIYALASYGPDLHAGGWFGTVGAVTSPRWARFSATGTPWFATHPQSRNVTSGQDVSFTSQPAEGFGPLSLQWVRSGTPLADGPTLTGSIISGATQTTLSIQNVSQADAGIYRLVASNVCGTESSFDASLTVDGVTAVEPPDTVVVTAFESLGPNPASGPTQLVFSLEREGRVSMLVHDIAGRLVRRVDLGRLPAGRHGSRWNGRADNGRALASGVYFVRLDLDDRSLGVRRLTFVR